MGHFVSFDQVSKIYRMGEVTIKAADKISFEIDKGEFCVIVGPSGAGKTTVLNMLGGMDTCDEGTILLDGSRISDYNQKELTRYRRYDVGFVFQFYNLVQNLTALENVELASEICENPLDASETLAHVGLSERTGALDYNTGKTILKLLQDTCRSMGKTVIVITHNQAITAMADRVIHIKSGTVTDMALNPNPTPVERIEW